MEPLKVRILKAAAYFYRKERDDLILENAALKGLITKLQTDRMMERSQVERLLGLRRAA